MRGTRSHERAQVLLGRLEAAGAAAEAEQGRARETLSHSMRAVEHKIAGFQASEAARYAVSAQSGQGPEPLPAPPPAGCTVDFHCGGAVAASGVSGFPPNFFITSSCDIDI